MRTAHTVVKSTITGAQGADSVQAPNVSHRRKRTQPHRGTQEGSAVTIRQEDATQLPSDHLIEVYPDDDSTYIFFLSLSL